MNYSIKNAFILKSAQKLMQPSTFYTPQSEDEEAELKLFAEDGSCVPVPSTPALSPAPAAPSADEEPDTPLDPSDDLSVVPGIGAKTEQKLKEANITGLAQLKAAVLDAGKTEDMKTLLGTSYDKILAYFQAA